MDDFYMLCSTTNRVKALKDKLSMIIIMDCNKYDTNFDYKY